MPLYGTAGEPGLSGRVPFGDDAIVPFGDEAIAPTRWALESTHASQTRTPLLTEVVYKRPVGTLP